MTAVDKANDDFREAMLGDFLDESGQLLDRLNENLLQLDQWVRSLGEGEGGQCDPDLLNEMFRSAHSLKGLSAMLGLNDVNQLTHKIENVFDAARKGDLLITSDLVELMFHGVDRLGTLVQAILQPDAREVDCSPVLEAIARALQAAGVERKAGSQAEAERLMAAAQEAIPSPVTAPPLAEIPSSPDSPIPARDASDSAPAEEADADDEDAAARYRSLFIDETELAIDQLSETLLTVEGDNHRDAQEKLLVIAHRIKGSAAAVGLDDAARLAHRMEDVIQDLINRGGTLSPEITDVMLRCMDGLRQYTADLKQGGRGRDFGELIAALAALRPDAAATGDANAGGQSPRARNAAPPTGADKDAAAAPAATAARNSESKNRPGETLRVDIERLDHLMNLAGQLVIARARFSQIGDRLRTVAGGKNAGRTLEKAVETLAGMAEGDCPAGPASLSHGGHGAGPEEELHRARAGAKALQADLARVSKEVAAMAGFSGTLAELLEAVHQLELVSNGIQQSVMGIRMVPVGPLFTRFKRVIRDITRGNGKDIQLVLLGEKTELDKRMIDELGDPLIHLVRNAADHGIESGEDRLAAGKPAQGTVTLNAFHRGNSIVIQVSDDGKGLDEQRIRRKCVEKGLFAEADVAKMTYPQLCQMIWEPGFSTAEKVTEVSGRGMGMDIVKSKIEGLNGTVDVESEPGKGTMFSIRLPLTLAILPSLLVEIDGDVYAIPVESLVEIVALGPEQLTTVHGRRTARVRQRVVSMVKMDDVFRSDAPRRRPARGDDVTVTLVIVGQRGSELGLAVDRVIGEEDIVIKSISENYRNVAGIAGASILGDGRVSLILDVGAVMDMASRMAAVRMTAQGRHTPRAMTHV